MTQVQGFTVALERDISENDAHALRVLISQLRNVLSVETITVDERDHIARQRARKEMGTKLWDVVGPPPEGF